MTIEAVFESYQKYAVWTDDTTEVALWNSQTNDFTDCYEVLRSGGNFYFRTIPRLTRPVLTHGGMPADCPLEFTETAEQRQEWLRETSAENWKAIRQSVSKP